MVNNSLLFLAMCFKICQAIQCFKCHKVDGILCQAISLIEEEGDGFSCIKVESNGQAIASGIVKEDACENAL